MEPQPERSLSTVSLSSYLRLLRGNRNFRRLWMAQIVSELGDWFYTLSIYTLLLQLTGRASSVALALVLQVLPQTFVGPLAGVVNDRLRRKHVMIAADLVRFAVVLAMLLVRSRSMVWMVYPLLLAETIMAAFFEPARNAVIPNIAAKEEILMLQLHTDDKFRGRVFSADLGFAMLTIAAGAFLCGRLLDAGISTRAVATGTGLAMLVPAALWAISMRFLNRSVEP